MQGPAALGLFIAAAPEAELFKQACNGDIIKSAGLLLRTSFGLFPLRMQSPVAHGLLIAAAIMLRGNKRCASAELFKQA